MVNQKSAVEKALGRLEFVLVAESSLEDVSARTLASLLNQGMARRLVEITDTGHEHLSELRGETIPKPKARRQEKK